MRKMLLNNWSLKLLSLLIAIIAWVVIVNYDNPNTTRVINGIPIDVVGAEVLEESDMTYRVVGNQTASVRVRCPRRLAQNLKVADFQATADFSSLYSPTNQIPVVITSNNTRVLDSYLTQITQSLEVQLEEIETRQMDVGVTVSGDPAEGYIVGRVTPSPSVVTVKAPASIMDQISRIGVEIGVTSLSQNMTQHAPLVYYNAGGNVIDTTGMDDLQANNTDITVLVEIENVKNVSITGTVSGTEEVAKGYRYAGMTVSPETVKVSGRRTLLEDLSSALLPEDDLDLTGAAESVSRTYQLSDLKLPAGVSLVDSPETEVTVTLAIEKLETATFELDLSRVEMQNLDEALFIENEDTKLAVTVEGLASDLEALEPSEISAVVDLAGLAAGAQNVTAQVEVPEGFNVVGTATLRLQLAERSTTQAEEGEAAPAGAGELENSGKLTPEAADSGENLKESPENE